MFKISTLSFAGAGILLAGLASGATAMPLAPQSPQGRAGVALVAGSLVRPLCHTECGSFRTVRVCRPGPIPGTYRCQNESQFVAGRCRTVC